MGRRRAGGSGRLALTRGLQAVLGLAAGLALGTATASADPVVSHRLTVSVTGSGTVIGSGVDCPTLCSQTYPETTADVIGFGHSIAAGVGSSDAGTHSWIGLLSSDLGAGQQNYGVGGAVAAYPDGQLHPGGWAFLLDAYRPGDDLAANPLQTTNTLMQGLNDLAVLGGPGRLGPFEQAMTTMVSRLDSIAVFEDDDPSVSVPSGWTSYPSQDVNSGTTVLTPDALYDPITISVPPSFQGGTIALGFSTSAGSAKPTGQAVYGVSVDNASASTYTIDGPTMVTPISAGGGGWIGTVDRIGSLAPGRHAIRVALESTSGTISSAFDYWQAEVPFMQARPIVLPLQYLISDAGYAAYAGDPYIPDDAGVEALNAVIEDVSETFPPNVQTVALDLGKNATDLAADQVHPSDAGYAVIAQQVLAALSSVTLSATPAAGSTFAGWSGGGCGGTGTCRVTLSEDQSVTAQFVHDSTTAGTPPATSSDESRFPIRVLSAARLATGAIRLGLAARESGHVIVAGSYPYDGHYRRFGGARRRMTASKEAFVVVSPGHQTLTLLRHGHRLRVRVAITFTLAGDKSRLTRDLRIIDAIE